MAKRKLYKNGKELVCACGCNQLCSGRYVVKAEHAVNYVEKLGFEVWENRLIKPLTPVQLRIKEMIESEGQ